MQAALPFTYLLFSLRTTAGFFAFSLPSVGFLAILAALWGGTIVSLQGFIGGILINILVVTIILRIGAIVSETSLFSFIFQLSLVTIHNLWADVDPHPGILVISRYNE